MSTNSREAAELSSRVKQRSREKQRSRKAAKQRSTMHDSNIFPPEPNFPALDLLLFPSKWHPSRSFLFVVSRFVFVYCVNLFGYYSHTIQ
jgi:hypothetical protein